MDHIIGSSDVLVRAGVCGCLRMSKFFLMVAKHPRIILTFRQILSGLLCNIYICLLVCCCFCKVAARVMSLRYLWPPAILDVFS